MEIKLSEGKDINAIMEIIKDAQELLASQNIDQWQNAYPNIAQIKEDIHNKNSFVICKKHEIIASLMFSTKIEHTYNEIDGKWLSAEKSKYGVIHRLAVSKHHHKKGIAKFIFTYFENLLSTLEINSMKIDTHPDNITMQTLLKKMNYIYCGVIYLEDNDKRFAYEKILKK